MEASFEEPELFQSRYQRNNKRGGLKNLRCFPTCAALHRERGFCGRMVVISVQHPMNDKKLRVYGEFVPVSDTNIGLKLNDTVSLNKIAEVCRDKSNPLRPWMEGELIEEKIQGNMKISRFAFNRDKKGWHYGWASNKHTCNANHALQAYVMEPALEIINSLQVKSVHQSPHFTLFCRRRRRFAMVPSAPIAPPSSKKRSAKERKETIDDDEEEDEEEEEDDDDETPLEKATKKPKSKKLKLTPPKEKPVSASSSKKKLVVIQENLHSPRKTSELEIARVEKILHAISKRMAQVKPTLPPTSLDPLSCSDSGSVATTIDPHQEQQTSEQFSSDLFDCIDFFAGDSLLEDHAFEGDFGIDFADGNRIVDNFMAYLLEERQFTQSISAIAKNRNSLKINSELSFDQFVNLLSSHLNGFLKKNSISLEEFDSAFPVEATNEEYKSGGELLARHAFAEIIEQNLDSSTIEQLDFSTLASNLGIEKMVGSWILAPNNPSSQESALPSPSDSSSNEDDIETMRESLGYPWVLRKMLNFMEEKFQVSLDNITLSVRLQRKLLSSGAMTIVLDGEEHDWGLKLPLFEGIVKAWKYRAWVNDQVVHHVHDTGERSRMRRTMWVDETDSLKIDISLEEYNEDNQTWEIVAHAVQRAVRCE